MVSPNLKHHYANYAMCTAVLFGEGFMLTMLAVICILDVILIFDVQTCRLVRTAVVPI
jgi:hypothetical protein